MSNRAQNARRALGERQAEFDRLPITQRGGRKRPGSENPKRSIPSGTGKRSQSQIKGASRNAVQAAGG